MLGLMKTQPGPTTGSSSSPAVQSSQASQQSSETMLSMNFSAPLQGPAREEKVKQMMNGFSGMETLRAIQESFLWMQTALRRMPGIGPNMSKPIIGELQEVSVTLNQEFMEMAEALAQITLDDMDKAQALSRLNSSGREKSQDVSSMTLNVSLARAQVEEQGRLIEDLRRQLAEANEKREQAGREVVRISEDLGEMSSAFKAFREHMDSAAQNGAGASQSDRDEMVKVGESATSPQLVPLAPLADGKLVRFSKLQSLESQIKHLEEQVNNRRSIWAMRQSSPESVAKAIERMAQPYQNDPIVQKALSTLSAVGQPTPPTNPEPQVASKFTGSPFLPRGPVVPPPRSASVHPSMSHPPVSGPPPRFGPLCGPLSSAPHHPPPHRAPTAFVGGHNGSAWGPPANNARAASTSLQLAQQNRAPMRRPPYSGGAQHRPTAPEFHPANQGNALARPGTSFGVRRDGIGPGAMSGPRNVSLFREYASGTNMNAINNSNNINMANGNAMGMHTGALMGPGAANPLIHVSDHTIGAWNDGIAEVYTKIRRAVMLHANQPQEGATPRIKETGVWQIILSTYKPLSLKEAESYANHHLTKRETKTCLATRVLVEFVVQRIWILGAWMGLDEETDGELREVTQEFAETQKETSHVRQPILDRQARVLQSIMRRGDYEQYRQYKVLSMARILVEAMQPIINRGADPHAVHASLEAAVGAAWAVGAELLSSRLTFDFRFPDVGTRFSAQSMLPIWPMVDPLEVQSRHLRVAMVTTPVITCRNDTGANISAHSVTKADVFCML